MTHPKFEALVDRLVTKMQMSQTPVPGFIIGLSGTDSIVAYMLCYRAARKLSLAQHVIGIHYCDKMTWIVREIMPWLWQTFPLGSNFVAEPKGGNRDEFRWADMHVRAKESDLWTVGTMNATEKALGKYSLLSTAVSIQPLQTLYKSTILEICEAYNVPRIAIENARIPDCLCGRDDFAAENIEIIDALLRFDGNPLQGKSDKIDKAMAYIKQCKVENGFRDRVPYTI